MRLISDSQIRKKLNNDFDKDDEDLRAFPQNHKCKSISVENSNDFQFAYVYHKEHRNKKKIRSKLI